MSRVPSLGYPQIVRALQRDGWVVIRQRGSHIRLQKHVREETLKLTVPAHRPVKRERADLTPSQRAALRRIVDEEYR